MKASNDMVVTMHYTLTDDSGEVLDSSSGREPLAYLHGHGNIIPGLEQALEGQESGFQSKVTIAAADAYGERNDEAVVEADRDSFPEEMNPEPGMQVYAEGPEGPIPFTIVAVDGDKVKLDANHPLAGKTLHFEVEITEIRQGSSEEIEHGHVHDGNEHH